MKSIYKISFVLLLTVVGSSCKKYLELENPSTISFNATFGSVSNTNTAIIGVYNLLPGDNGITKEGTVWSLSADDFKTSGSYSAQDRRGISMYGANKENGELEGGFKQLYTGIERANICIKGIRSSDLYADGSSSKAQMGKYLGEALTLRALYYFILVRNWGNVVSQWEPSGDTQVWDVPVTAGTEILDKLLADLKEAEALVPWIKEGSPLVAAKPEEYVSSRWTKGGIKALRARIALFRGGYMMDKQSHTMTRSADYKKYYQIALDECKDLMQNRNYHTLNPVYENIFKSLHTSTRIDTQNELMFEVGAYGAGSRTDTKLGYYNGLRLNGASRFGQGGGGIMAIATYFYEFDQLYDVRRDVTIGSYEIDANNQKVMNTLNNMTDAKFRKSWTTHTGPIQTLAVNWPVIRFADVLLMYAEADNEVNGAPSVEAVAALREVRERAYAARPDMIPVIPADYTGFFNAIVKERLLEFGGESIRKYDLIRWNIMAAKFAETRTKLRELMNGTGAYANVPLNVYSKPAAYNLVTSTQEFATLDTFGGSPNVTLYQPNAGTPATNSGYVTKAWRASINEEYITGGSTGFATFFEANKKEVFPFHQNVLLYNTKTEQNFGY
ncbi:RagB/SusD family nutrient uptake outer membrane protein [Pedobacter xixiisoli]|uniref:Starch-binding associating with outer membrane n=1 Tax=Pedobacter xixiisoli TaxID=1476464 RepID=A0A285ZR64_9SPHI|nr:RagB/SusD family nutrient uptake outer membrane protein [Pedobacter xixiisoli]SOD12144.1 Starch-binding associating with outer membrane [Pedobacter xixiisoli]